MGNTSFHKITEVKQLGRTWMGAHSSVEMDAVQYIVKNTVKPWSGETGPLIRACSSGKNVFLKIKIQKTFEYADLHFCSSPSGQLSGRPAAGKRLSPAPESVQRRRPRGRTWAHTYITCIQITYVYTQRPRF